MLASIRPTRAFEKLSKSEKLEMQAQLDKDLDYLLDDDTEIEDNGEGASLKSATEK